MPTELLPTFTSMVTYTIIPEPFRPLVAMIGQRSLWATPLLRLITTKPLAVSAAGWCA